MGNYTDAISICPFLFNLAAYWKERSLQYILEETENESGLCNKGWLPVNCFPCHNCDMQLFRSDDYIMNV